MTESVPERCVLGQAVASQVPLLTLVIFALTAPAGVTGNAANSIIAMVMIATVLWIWIEVFVFIILQNCDKGGGVVSSPE